MSGRVIRRVATGVALLAATQVVHTGAAAQTLCSRPVEPLCSTDLQAADTAPERLRCREDMDRYIESLEQYRECLNSSLEQAEERVEAAKRFQSCLRNEGDDCSIDRGS